MNVVLMFIGDKVAVAVIDLNDDLVSSKKTLNT